MAFPLVLAGVDKAPSSKVDEAAEMLELTKHLDRKPANLSGGQRSGWQWAARSCAAPRRS